MIGCGRHHAHGHGTNLHYCSIRVRVDVFRCYVDCVRSCMKIEPQHCYGKITVRSMC